MHYSEHDLTYLHLPLKFMKKNTFWGHNYEHKLIQGCNSKYNFLSNRTAGLQKKLSFFFKSRTHNGPLCMYRAVRTKKASILNNDKMRPPAGDKGGMCAKATGTTATTTCWRGARGLGEVAGPLSNKMSVTEGEGEQQY
jgi:hypothetical protein